MTCPECTCVFCPDATGNPRSRYCSRACRVQAKAARRRRRQLCQAQCKETYPGQAAAETAASRSPFPAEAYQCGGHWHIAMASRSARYARRNAQRRAREQIATQPAYVMPAAIADRRGRRTEGTTP